MYKKLEQLLSKRENLKEKITKLQKERKRINNAISRERHKEKQKKSNLNLHCE